MNNKKNKYGVFRWSKNLILLLMFFNFRLWIYIDFSKIKKRLQLINFKALKYILKLINILKVLFLLESH